MIDVSHLKLQSKLLKHGQFGKHLDFAVRGLPRNYLPSQQHVDYQKALDVYEEAIVTLDGLHPEAEYFTSGVNGAAIITTTLHPEAIEFWRALSYRNVHHDQDGFCAPGLLCQLIETNQRNVRLTRRNDYQLYLFQSALAVTMAWIADKSADTRYLALPPVPDAPRLIEQVRIQLHARNSLDGFRPVEVLQEAWHEVAAPRLAHCIDPEVIKALAIEGARILDDPPDAGAVSDAADWVIAENPDPELAHPAALAAAAVSIARDPDCRRVWSQVFNRAGCWRPTRVRRVEADASGMIHRCIMDANRANDTGSSARKLFKRILAAIDLWTADNHVWRQTLPRPKETAPLEPFWKDISVEFAPLIAFSSRYEDASESRSKDQKTGKGNRKASPDAPGKRQKTGRAGEDWFMENYRSVFPEFPEAELLDHRLEFTGYDFLLKMPEMEIFIDVKAVQSNAFGPVEVDDCQWQRALSAGSNYYLVVVSGLKNGEPVARKYKNPAGRLKPIRNECEITVVSWTLNAGELERESEQAEARTGSR